MPPPKAQPPRKRSGQRTVWQLKRWKAGTLLKEGLVKCPADGVSLVVYNKPRDQSLRPKGQQVALEST